MRRAIIKMCPRRRRPRSPLRARDRDYCPSNIAHTPLLYARGQVSLLVMSKLMLTLVDKTSAD
jgi:hypothetical protein